MRRAGQDNGGRGEWTVGRFLVEWIEIAASEFDLEKTLSSGQVFHWTKHQRGFAGTIHERAVYLEQNGSVLRAQMATASSKSGQDRRRDVEEILSRYFALDHRLSEICASFPNDETMNAARDFCRGLRILRQPRWECLAMFICSSMKQVAHIRQMGAKLRERLGKRREVAGTIVYTFPAPDLLANAPLESLRECALGYRAPNLKRTAELVADGTVNLERLQQLPDEELHSALCRLPGVGAKVANCVMLFAYERLRAFPIDVWIARVLKDRYFARKRNVTPKKLRDFSADYFGNHGGYAQQYLFHHARTTKSRAKPPSPRGRPTRKRGPVRSSLHDNKGRVT